VTLIAPGKNGYAMFVLHEKSAGYIGNGWVEGEFEGLLKLERQLESLLERVFYLSL
jgi:hypothetical protein